MGIGTDRPPGTKPDEATGDAQLSIIRKILVSRDGLRAGWSILTCVALLAAFLYGATAIRHILQTPTHRHSDHSVITLTFTYMSHLGPFHAALLAAWIMSKIEHRPISVYGLGGRRKLAHFFAGLAWGVACLALLIFAPQKKGLLVVETRLLFGKDIFRYAALWLGGLLLVALTEEFLTRGYLQYTLTRGLTGLYLWAFGTRYSATLGFWTSALIFSVLFGLGHGKNPGESPIGLLSVGLIALVFCLSLWRRGSLWWVIGGKGWAWNG